jgi:phosphatidate cytidylyltransferase
MKRVLTAIVLIPVVLGLVFLAPKWLFALCVALVAMLASWEYMNLAEQGGFKPPRIAVLVAELLLFAGYLEWPDRAMAIFGLLSLLIFVYCTFKCPVERVMADAASSIFGLVYVASTLLVLPVLHAETNGPSLVTFLLCTVWAGDSLALYAGKFFGKHKLAPKLSPKKTWEGSVGSVLGSVLAAILLMVIASILQKHDITVLTYADETWYWLLLAVVVNVAAQVGDLAESGLKRSVGVKDSGNLLPGHGGMLDRIDALLLAAPALWYLQLLRQVL